MFNYIHILSYLGTIVLVFVWSLDLQLHVHVIVPIIMTEVMSSNLAHGWVNLIQHYVILFVNDLQKDGGFLRVLRFPPPI